MLSPGTGCGTLAWYACDLALERLTEATDLVVLPWAFLVAFTSLACCFSSLGLPDLPLPAPLEFMARPSLACEKTEGH